MEFGILRDIQLAIKISWPACATLIHGLDDDDDDRREGYAFWRLKDVSPSPPLFLVQRTFAFAFVSSLLFSVCVCEREKKRERVCVSDIPLDFDFHTED